MPTWDVIAAGIQGAIATAGGVTAIWSYQNAPAPALPYVTLALGPASTVGVDWVQTSDVPAWVALTPYVVGDRVINNGGRTYSATVAGTSGNAGGPTGTGAAIVDGSVTWAFVAAGGEVVEELGGLREVTLEIQCYTATTTPVGAVAPVSTGSALALAETIKGKLRMPTARDALRAVGFVPLVGEGTINYVPEIVSAGFRGRAVLDVRSYLPAPALVEYCAYIAQVGATLNVVGGPGGTLSPTFTAP